MITISLITIAFTLVIIAVALISLLGVLSRINATLAVQSSVQLAYLVHSDEEALRNEGAAIKLSLLMRNGLQVVRPPEGEVDA